MFFSLRSIYCRSTKCVTKKIAVFYDLHFSHLQICYKKSLEYFSAGFDQDFTSRVNH